MMQIIRDKVQGIVTWTIVAVITIAFCSWGANNYFSDSSGSSLAIVNGKKISSYQVDELYNRWFRYASAQKGFDIKLVSPALIKQQIVQGLAQQQAIIVGLERSGFAISDSMLIANIQQDPNLQERGRFSMERYKNYLAQLNMSENTFEQARRAELFMQQAQQGIITSSFSLPNEVDKVIQIRNQKRSFNYGVISAAQYKPVAAGISNAQIEEYYTKHADFFSVPEKIKLEYIELSIDDLMNKVDINEQKLHDYYKNNLSQFSTPELRQVRHIMIAAPQDSTAMQSGSAKAKIDSIHSELGAGKSFTDLAKQFSEDPQTAVKGGDLGWIGKSDEYPSEVYALNKDNEYTPVVQTIYGWHIFQLVAHKPSQPQNYSMIKNSVSTSFKRDAAEKLFSNQGEELANLTEDNPQSLAVASEKLKLPIKSTEYFTREGGSGIAAAKNVIATAFSEDVLTKRKNSELIRISDDSYVVIRVAAIDPQHQQPLDSIRSNIVSILQNTEAQLKTKKLGEELLQEIQQGKKPEANIAWRSAQNIARENTTIAPAVLQQAFTLSKPAAGQAVTSSGTQLANGDYLVVELTAVTEGALDKADTAHLRKIIAPQIVMLKGQLEFASLQTALIDKAKIKYLSSNQE